MLRVTSDKRLYSTYIKDESFFIFLEREARKNKVFTERGETEKRILLEIEYNSYSI